MMPRVKSVRRADPRTAIAEALARLEQGLHELALELARAELERLGAARTAGPRSGRPQRAPARRSRRSAAAEGASSAATAPPTAPAVTNNPEPTSSIPMAGPPEIALPNTESPATEAPPVAVIDAATPPLPDQQTPAGDPAEHRRRVRYALHAQGGFTGDPAIDAILALYQRPPQLGAA
jgi:hypothetical protein